VDSFGGIAALDQTPNELHFPASQYNNIKAEGLFKHHTLHAGLH
jgi:hypothetical protein